MPSIVSGAGRFGKRSSKSRATAASLDMRLSLVIRSSVRSSARRRISSTSRDETTGVRSILTASSGSRNAARRAVRPWPSAVSVAVPGSKGTGSTGGSG